MKKVKSYTAGWDAENKQGYLTVLDDDNNNHFLSKLERDEFSLLLQMLKEEQDVFIDQNNWLVSGWIPESKKT